MTDDLGYSYKGWRIRQTSYFSPGNGWSPDVRISFEDGGWLHEKHFFPKTPTFFSTKEEADCYAIEMGRVAVDSQ